MSEPERRQLAETLDANHENHQRGKEALANLRSLIEEVRGKKNWTSAQNQQARDLFAEVMRWEDMNVAAALAVEIPVEALERVIQEDWAKLSAEDKESFIHKLLKSPADKEKAAIRQMAVAEKLASLDCQSGIKLLAGAVAPAGKKRTFWPALPLYKKEQLLRRFILSSFKWSSLDTDAEFAGPLLAAFLEAADDDKVAKSPDKGGLLNFTRWAARVLNRLGLDEKLRGEVQDHILRITQTLHPDLRKEIELLAQPTTLPSPPSPLDVNPATPPLEDRTPPTEQPGAQTAEVETQPLTARDSTGPAEQNPKGTIVQQNLSSEESVSQHLPTPLDRAPAPTASAKEGRKLTVDDLTKRRQAEIERGLSTLDSLRSDIEHAQAEVEFIKGLDKSLRRSEAENAKLQEQLNNLEETRSRLQESNDRLHSLASESKQRIEELEAERLIFKEKAEALDNELVQEKIAREEESEYFADEIERQIQNKVNGFKGSLRKRLIRIFNNKRSTDDQQESAELTRFLRERFQELEDELEEAGIQLKQDAL